MAILRDSDFPKLDFLVQWGLLEEFDYKFEPVLEGFKAMEEKSEVESFMD